MVIWYDILAAINIVSKTLQSEDMDIDDAITQLKGLVFFFQKYRETGFEEALIEAKKIAVAMDIEPIFHVKKKRLIKKRTHFDEETRQDNNESVVLNEEEKFKIDYFINIMDQALVSLQTSLKESCINLEDSLKHGARSDIDGNDLFFEIKVFRETLPKVASAERSFSKLKLIKSYLRSTMSQDRLNGLAMISIERDMVKHLDYESLMNDFAEKKANRVIFKN
ncbi:hypothetical protein RND81_05G021600 [Saponaria officinalis]|uniref:HAT C-terminal dimerisation domain-containing protein n=1 Tax=Saponaria officinalis TaxID=3572 RepID=A0AAW1KSZ0_SAPOF